jgi:hypothetical protein
VTAPGRAGRIDGEILRALRAIHTHDHLVRDVGAAFERADRSPPVRRTPALRQEGDLRASEPISVDDNDLAAALLAIVRDETEAGEVADSVRRGTDLGRRVAGQGTMTPADLAELAAHQDDPYFAAAFFNAIPPPLALALLHHFGDWGTERPTGTDYSGVFAKALTSAYASGVLSPDFHKAFAADLIHNPWSRLRPQFYQDLGLDHRAARTFVESLTDDQLHRLLTGYLPQAAYADLPASVPRFTDPNQTMATFLKVLSSAVAGYDDHADVQRFVARVGGVLETIKSVDFAAVAPELFVFLYTAEAQLIDPLPVPPTQDSLLLWSIELGHQLHPLFTKLSEWIDKVGKASEQDGAALRSIVEGAVVAAAVATLPLDLAVGATAVGALALVVAPKVATAAVSGAAESWVQLQLDDLLAKQSDHPDRAAQHAFYLTLQGRMTVFLMVTRMIAQGQVVKVNSAGKETAVTLATEEQILAVVQHPIEYKIKGIGKSVYSVLADMMAGRPDMNYFIDGKP